MAAMYLDISNTLFLLQCEDGLYYVPQDEADEGTGWQIFTPTDFQSEMEAQELFDSLIRCHAPRERIPLHLLSGTDAHGNRIKIV